MLHSLKKRVSLAQGAATGGVPLPPEVLQLKLKLAGVRKQVTDTTGFIDKANAQIKVDVSQQMMFGRTFSKAYSLGPDSPPPADAEASDVDSSAVSEGREQAVAFAKQSEAVYNTHCRSGSPDEKWAQYKTMNVKLKAYAAAIAKVEAKYPRLNSAKSESMRYNTKFDSLMQKGKADDLKMSRNLQKSDECKTRYQDLLAEVLAEQRALYAKAPDALRMLLVVYWGTKDRHMEIMRQTFDETAAWARENEGELLELDVAAIDFPVDVDEEEDAEAAEYQDAAADAPSPDSVAANAALASPTTSAIDAEVAAPPLASAS